MFRSILGPSKSGALGGKLTGGFWKTDVLVSSMLVDQGVLVIG